MAARRMTVGWGLTAGLLLAACAGWLIFSHPRAGANHQITKSKSTATTDSKSGTANRVRANVIYPKAGGIPWSVTRPASVHSFQSANLYAKVSGYLQNQTVDIGDRVKQGQLLAELFAPEIVAGVQKARADLLKSEAMVQVAEAQVAEAQAELVQSRANLAQKQADLESAQALLTLRQEQYHRISELSKLNAIQKELVDEKLESRRAAESDETASVKAVATAQAGIAAAEAQVARTKADVANAQAEVQVSQAALAQAQALNEYTKIRSPYTGVITARNFHDGDLIRDASTADGHPVLAVAETDLMRVIVWVPDEDVPDTHRGNPVVLHIDALGDREFNGKVARTALSEDYDSRTMRVEIDIPNPDGLLVDGMFGRATINLLSGESGVNIPTACLRGDEKNGQREVYVVRGGLAHIVTVRVGHNDGIHAQVLSGLKTTDEVIADHGPGLAVGVPVEAVAAESKPAAKGSQDESAAQETATK